ncbi:MAG: hypothetical protein ACFFCZ_02405 [Promethearchaeota archaeon]
MIAKSPLHNFPPRKTRAISRLIKFLIATLLACSPFQVSLPQQSCYSPSQLYELLVLTAVTRNSISQKSRDLRDRSRDIPAGETVLRWLKRPNLEDLITHHNKQVKTFVDRLTNAFQDARKKGMVLVLDCHTDPNYGKDSPPYIIKGRNKASTHRMFWYIMLLWANAPEPLTLGVKLMPHPRQFYQESQELLAPWLATEQITYVLADGDYYNWDLVQ